MSDNPQLPADDVLDPMTALRLIAGPCETYVEGSIRCWDTDRTPDALYGGSRWCDACIAQRALLNDGRDDA